MYEMYEYKITYSYWQDNRRVKEHDIFFASSSQEAVAHCRAENNYLFSEMFGRIESVLRDTGRAWEAREDWE